LNLKRYYFQGIGRYPATAAYARGLADLQVLVNVVPADGYVHGPMPSSIDAAIYGFMGKIYFYEIETPLKQFVTSQPNLVRHCTAVHCAQLEEWRATSKQRATPHVAYSTYKRNRSRQRHQKSASRV